MNDCYTTEPVFSNRDVQDMFPALKKLPIK